MTEHALDIDGVSVRRGGRMIFADLSLHVVAGEVVGVVGVNGCGKSTLLACIAGVLPPRDGRITIAGHSVWGARHERASARRALGYVPEGADPPGFLRAEELWSLCAATRGSPPPSPALRDVLGLDELRDQAIERMSLGQRRRTCLAAALIGSPSVLILDEPDNGLDAKRHGALIELVRQHVHNGGSCLLASHDAGLLEQLGARVWRMPEPEPA